MANVSTGELIQNIYNPIKQMVMNKKVTTPLLMQATIYAMTLVERNGKDLDGSQKKEVVVQVLTMLSGEIPADDATKQLMQLFVAETLPPLIDNIIASENGALEVINNGCSKGCASKCNIM